MPPTPTIGSVFPFSFSHFLRLPYTFLYKLAELRKRNDIQKNKHRRAAKGFQERAVINKADQRATLIQTVTHQRKDSKLQRVKK